MNHFLKLDLELSEIELQHIRIVVSRISKAKLTSKKRRVSLSTR